MANVIPRKSEGNQVEFEDKLAIWVNRAAALVSKDTKPATPADFSGAQREYAVLLTWTPVATADFYNLYVASTNDVNAKQLVGRLNGEVSSFLHYLGVVSTRYYWLEAGTNTGRVGELVQTSGTSTGLSGSVPTGHHVSHEDGGSDEINVTGLSGLLATPQTPAAHKTSHQDGGSDEISVTGLSGLLADAQTPLGHHTSHESGGGDSIKLDDLATPDDNTDLNASTSRHGLLRKLDNDPAHFLDGQGNWSTPSGGGSSPTGYYAPVTNGDLAFPEIVFEDGDVVVEFVEL